MAPWYDYQRRLSPLKLAVFIALFIPGLWVMVAFPMGWLGARPVNEAIHQIGLWMFRFLFIALAITPLRKSSTGSGLRWCGGWSGSPPLPTVSCI